MAKKVKITAGDKWTRGTVVGPNDKMTRFAGIRISEVKRRGVPLWHIPVLPWPCGCGEGAWVVETDKERDELLLRLKDYPACNWPVVLISGWSRVVCPSCGHEMEEPTIEEFEGYKRVPFADWVTLAEKLFEHFQGFADETEED